MRAIGCALREIVGERAAHPACPCGVGQDVDAGTLRCHRERSRHVRAAAAASFGTTAASAANRSGLA